MNILKGAITTHSDRDPTNEDQDRKLGDEEMVSIRIQKKTNSNTNPGSSNNNSKSSLVSILPLSPERGDSFNNDNEGFDICREYGYKYEYTEDEEEDKDEDDNHNHDTEEEFYDTITSCDFITLSPISNSNTKTNQSKNNQNSNIRHATDVNHTDNNNKNNNIAQAVTTNKQSNTMNINYIIYFLGKKYHPLIDYAPKRDDESNLFWFTYRCNFLDIKPYNITSDAGWGCMLRSAQMLLAQAFKIHYNNAGRINNNNNTSTGGGRDFEIPKSLVKKRENMFLQDLLMWFADFPSLGHTGCFYSLHNMVAAGLSRYETLPGEWFGPGTICYILRDLAELHAKAWEDKFKTQKKSQLSDDIVQGSRDYFVKDDQTPNSSSVNHTENSSSSTTNNSNTNGSNLMNSYSRAHPPLRIYVAQESVIYRDEIDELMTRNSKTFSPKQDGNIKNQTQNNNIKNTTLTKATMNQHTNQTTTTEKKQNNDPLLHFLHTSKAEQETKTEQVPWDTSLLILIPLRLGLNTFNAESYSTPLAHTFSLSQSVGFIGGLPRHALWFYGAHSDGSKIYGLDPHTVQNAPKRRRLRLEEERRTGFTKQYQVLLSDEYLRSIHCPNPSCMDMCKIDPSLALGFYCRDRNDFESFCDCIHQMKNINYCTTSKKKIPELFSIEKNKPDYTADISSAMVEMMMGGSVSHLDDCGDNQCHSDEDDDDDDDYVML